ncbi:MAG: hypothetical protein CL398_09310 [Acidiferrobacteraceae bacterium]|nr:hypothetical protein [Acidiferrobacteraceae bacterium]
MKNLFTSLAFVFCLAGTSYAGSYEDIDPTGGEATVWYRVSRDNQVAFLDQLTAEFNKTNPYGVTVTAVSAGGYGDIFTKFVNLIGTDELPDMVIGYQNQLALYNMPPGPGLIDMNDLVMSEKWAMPDKDMADIPAGFLAQDISSDFGGMRLGFPPRRSMELLYANMDWLAELGFDRIPSSPEEFKEAACKATKNPYSNAVDPNASPQGLVFGLDASRLASFIIAFGGETLDKEKGKYVLDSPEAIAAATLISEMSEEGCVRAATEKYGEQTDFGNGLTLFTTGSSSGLPYYGGAIDKGAKFNWSVYAVPHTTDQPRGNLYGPSFAITNKDDRRKQIAAWLWLQTFLKPENQAEFVRLTNYVPVRQSALDLLADYRAANPQFDIIRQLMPTAGSETPPSASYEEVRRLLREVLAELLSGGDARALMTDLNEEANELHAEALAELNE